MNLGTGTLANVKFVLGDLSGPIAKGTFPDVDGTLGYGVFSNRVVQLDYLRHTLHYSSVLSENSDCPVKRCGSIRLVTFGRKGPPIVVTDGFTINGRPLSVQVDTMFSGSLLVFPPAASRLGLKTLTTAAPLRYFPFTDEGVRMSHASGAEEGFNGKVLIEAGTVYFAEPGVHIPDDLFDGTVGAELLQGHTVTLDFKNMHFWLD